MATSTLGRVTRWFFENRQTGEITIAQAPNLSLGIFLGSKVVELATPDGRVSDIVGWIATGALLWWASDEVLRGVNPWRRILGAGVIAWQVARLLG